LNDPQLVDSVHLDEVHIQQRLNAPPPAREREANGDRLQVATRVVHVNQLAAHIAQFDELLLPSRLGQPESVGAIPSFLQQPNDRRSAASRLRALRFLSSRLPERRLQRLVARLPWLVRQLVTWHRGNVRDSSQDPIELCTAAAAPPSFQIFNREQGRGFFGNGGRDELIDRYLVALGQFPNLVVQ
jgi:hypothetical protein